MDILNQLIDGFTVAATPQNLLFALLGALLGTIIGALPGIGPSAGVAILLPLTFGMSPVTALIMLAGIYYGSMCGGTITSVLINTPGESASVATTFDGYQLAVRGVAVPRSGWPPSPRSLRARSVLSDSWWPHPSWPTSPSGWAHLSTSPWWSSAWHRACVEPMIEYVLAEPGVLGRPVNDHHARAVHSRQSDDQRREDRLRCNTRQRGSRVDPQPNSGGTNDLPALFGGNVGLLILLEMARGVANHVLDRQGDVHKPEQVRDDPGPTAPVASPRSRDHDPRSEYRCGGECGSNATASGYAGTGEAACASAEAVLDQVPSVTSKSPERICRGSDADSDHRDGVGDVRRHWCQFGGQ
jgi:Tripartite tricarboxylate transporter TctA family